MITFNTYGSMQGTMMQYLTKTQSSINHYTNILASNSAVYSAKVDPATSAMISRINGDLGTVGANIMEAQGAKSILEAADDAFSNVTDILEQMKSLAEDATDPTLTVGQRATLDAEYQDLIAQINALPATAVYNGKSVFTPANFDFAGLGFTIPTFGDVDDFGATLSTTDITDIANANAAITALDTALADVANKSVEVGGQINVQDFKINNYQDQQLNLQTASEQMMAYDEAEVTAQLAAAQTQAQIITALMAQANITQKNAMSILFNINI